MNDDSITLFSWLMENDGQFRKAVVGKASLYGMTLYRSASQISSSAAPQEPAPKKPVVKRHFSKRLKGKELKEAKQANAKIKSDILRVLANGRTTTEDLRSRLRASTTKKLNNRQHLTNNISNLIASGKIRRVPGTIPPNSQWEIVKTETKDAPS